MKQTVILAVLVATCVLVQGQGLRRWGHRGHRVGLPSPTFPDPPVPHVPIIPAPRFDRGGWTGDNMFGGPMFPGGMTQGQTWSTGPFWGQQWGLGGQTGQWSFSGPFGQNGQHWLSNSQNGWNNPLSGNTMYDQWLFNGLNEQWNGQPHNSWTITDGQDGATSEDNFGKNLISNTGNADPWGIYTQLTGGSQISGNPLLGNQQFGSRSGFTPGVTQNGWGSIDGSLTQNGFQPGNNNLNSGFPVLAGTSGFNGVQGVNMPPGMTGISTSGNNNNNNQFQRLKKK